MSFDAHANLALATISVGPSPALSGTTIIVGAGEGALFPAVPYNCTVYPGDQDPTSSNAEIVRVTNVTGDVLTITRAQEGTTAKFITTGFRIANTATVKVFTDIQNSIIQSIFAGTSVVTAPQVIFSNSNGVSFGAAGSVITASVNTAGGGGGSLAISAGTNSRSTGTIVLSNSNGVSFGMDAGGIITASASGAAQSTQPVAASASNGSFIFSTLGFSNANGVTFGTSAGSIVTASIAASAANSINFSGGTTSNNLTGIVFSNSNGVSFGLNGSTMTGSHNGLTSQSNQAASASNGSFTFQTLGFSNANGITFGTSAGSIVTASVAAGAAAGSVSAGTTSVALGQVVFSNSNNVTFGLAGSTITASVTVASTAQSTQPVAASASNGSFLFSTLGFSNANGVTFGTSAGSIVTASVGAGVAAGSISAGTASVALGQVVFSNSNNISFGLNGSTVTASIPAGALGVTLSSFEPVQLNNNATTNISMDQNVVWLMPVTPQCAISFNNIQYLASFFMTAASSNVSTTGTLGYTQIAGFYSRSVTNPAATNFSNSSNWVTMWSASATTNALWSASASSITASYQWQTDSAGGNANSTFSSNAASFSNLIIGGYKAVRFPCATSVSAGEYLFAQIVFSTTAGGNPALSLMRFSRQVMTVMTNLSWASDFGNVSTTPNVYLPGVGKYSATSAALPNSLAFSDIIHTNQLQRHHVVFNA